MRNARRNMMKRSTDGYTYTPPQQPEPPEPPERTVSVRIVSPERLPRTWLYRDEIFDVEITVTGEPAYTGTMRLNLIADTKHKTLGSRGRVQMYDFASGAANPFCNNDTSIRTITFAPADKGVKRFKAVVNQEQTIQIRVAEINDNGVENKEMSAVTPVTLVVYRLRQYTTKYSGNQTVNNYDENIKTWVNYWDDWNIPVPPEPAPENPEEPAPENPEEPVVPYTFMDGARPDPELVKAVTYKETNMKDQHKPNLMRVTSVATGGMTTGTQNDPAERDTDASVIPPGYDPDNLETLLSMTTTPFMNYGAPAIVTVDDSFKWGIRWLISKYTDHEYNRAQDKVYSVRALGWWSTTVQTENGDTEERSGGIKRYGDQGDETYEEDVKLLYQEGRNPHETNGKRVPEYLWPIKADGCPRQTPKSAAAPEDPAEENPETPPQE